MNSNPQSCERPDPENKNAFGRHNQGHQILQYSELYRTSRLRPQAASPSSEEPNNTIEAGSGTGPPEGPPPPRIMPVGAPTPHSSNPEVSSCGPPQGVGPAVQGTSFLAAVFFFSKMPNSL